MRASGVARWAPLSGALFVVLWVLAYVTLGDTVESSNSDAEILAYFGDDGQRKRAFLAAVLLLGSSLPFIVFLSVLRGRLEHGEGGGGVWTMAAYGAGLVSTMLWAVAAALYVVSSMTSDGEGGFELDPDTFRLLGDAGFLVWVTAGTTMSVLVLATSIVGIRAGIIPRWLSLLGFAVALCLLASFVVIPVILLLAWLFAVSIALSWRGDGATTPVARGDAV